MNIRFKEMEVQRYSDAISRQIEVVVEDLETGMILEVRTITDYGVRAYLWMKLKDMIVEVQPHTILDEEGKDLGYVKTYVRENLGDMVGYCVSELENLGTEVEEAEIRMSELTKMIGRSEDRT